MINRKSCVSIPYGTIKSVSDTPIILNRFMFQFLMVRLKVCVSVYLVKILLFQFLMVRLKATNIVTVITHVLVSIPYGTIKRLKVKKNNSLTLKTLRQHKDTKIIRDSHFIPSI